MQVSILIQLNHSVTITKEELAQYLSDEIDEIHNISIEGIYSIIEFRNTIYLPNDSFVSMVALELPVEDNLSVDWKRVVENFLNTLKDLDSIVSVTKFEDGLLQQQSIIYYKEICDIEMALRNVLTYILTYNEKKIDKDTLKSFGVRLAESFENSKVQEQYENGLFYILFNHYASFTKPSDLKAEEITKLLQDPALTSFESFKNELLNRGISEERHSSFLASIKTKLKTIENMRNSIMHMRNISQKLKDNYEKAMKGLGEEEGIGSLIDAFWIGENEAMCELTWAKLAHSQLDKLLNYISYDGEQYMVDEEVQDDELESEYDNIDALVVALGDRIKKDVFVLDFNPSDECFDEMLNKVSLSLEGLTNDD